MEPKLRLGPEQITGMANGSNILQEIIRLLHVWLLRFVFIGKVLTVEGRIIRLSLCSDKTVLGNV